MPPGNGPASGTEQPPGRQQASGTTPAQGDPRGHHGRSAATKAAQPAAEPAAKPATKPPAKAATKPAATAAQPAETAAKPVTPAEPALRRRRPVPKEPEPAPRPEAVRRADAHRAPRRARPAPSQNMDASLTVPTATSVRSVPVKLLIDNRIVINNHLARARGGKVSFTHLIGYALVKALKTMPEMNNGFDVVDGKPNLITPGAHQPRPGHRHAEARRHPAAAGALDQGRRDDGLRRTSGPPTRSIVRKARNNKLAVTDFQGTTISLTNPGTIGTNHSVPRLMKGQGAIIGVGSMDYPPEYQGASEETLTRNAVSKVMTLTSTYDHRVIQGAQSGEFLKRDPRAAARRGRLLRRDLPGAADPLRADPLGQGHLRPATTTRSASRPGSSS